MDFIVTGTALNISAQFVQAAAAYGPTLAAAAEAALPALAAKAVMSRLIM